MKTSFKVVVADSKQVACISGPEALYLNTLLENIVRMCEAPLIADKKTRQAFKRYMNSYRNGALVFHALSSNMTRLNDALNMIPKLFGDVDTFVKIVEHVLKPYLTGESEAPKGNEERAEMYKVFYSSMHNKHIDKFHVIV